MTEQDTGRPRIFILRILVLSLLLTLFGRLWFLQVLSSSKYVTAATANATREVVTGANRGLLLDDTGKALVTNKTAIVVSVSRADLLKLGKKGTAVLDRLAPILGIDREALGQQITPCDSKTPRGQKCWNGSPIQPVPVKTYDLDRRGDAGAAVKIQSIQERAEDFPGVTVDLQALRDYPQPGAVRGTKLAAHELGYLGPVVQAEVDKSPEVYRPRDYVGRDGLERIYDRDLRGTPGVKKVGVNARGDVDRTLSNTPPVPGADVVTNLSARVQRAAEQALQDALTKYAPTSTRSSNPTDAAAVVMTTDGRVVALASTPSYDPSTFTGGITQDALDRLKDPAAGKPLISRATNEIYAPGSTWKLFSAATALRYGLTTQGTYQPCSPELPVGTGPLAQVFRNFDGASAGPIPITTALEISCDTIFEKFGYEEWLADGALRGRPGAREVFTSTAKAFGFGTPTGIDLPSEAGGSIVDRKAQLAFHEATKAADCKRAQQLPKGREDQLNAQENCVDGVSYNGGLATQFVIGSGPYIRVTPLQLARAYAAVANGGNLYEPTIAKAVVRPDGRVIRTITPKKTGTVPISASDLAYLRQGLFQVTHGKGGTAAGLFGDKLFPVSVSGKTGTAEVLRLVDGQRDITNTSWFASFAPSDHPRYVVVVAVPKGGTGAETAAPAVRDIYKAIFGVTDDLKTATNPQAHPPTGLPCFDTTTVLPSAPKPGCHPKTVAPAPPAAGATSAPAAPAPTAGALGAPDPLLPPDRRTTGARQRGAVL